MSETILIHEQDSREELELYADAVQREFPNEAVRTSSTHDEALRQASDVTILVAKSVHVSRAMIAAMPGLKWVHSLISGVDHLRTVGLPESLLVTATRGIHGPQMAELAFLHMLALARRFPQILKNQERGEWDQWVQPLLLDKLIVIVGIGAISEVVAARCKAFGMRVEGISSGRSSAPGFDAVHPRERLEEAAARADFLLALVPYSPETHHIIGREVLSRMRPTAFFINLARGGVADEEALAEALTQGRIAGAGLDVFSREPLPPDSPLWRLKNVIITPHLGGRSDVYGQQALPLLVENIRLFLAGRTEAMSYRVRF